jgi:hypothetical protein
MIDELEKFIEENKKSIIEFIRNGLIDNGQNNANYIVVWKEYEEQSCKLFLEYLKDKININFIIAKSKSVYPEIIIIYDNKQYAFDIKVSVDSANPNYDIARIDTFEDRMKKYQEEFEIVIKYNVESGVVDIFIEKLKDVIGYNKKSKGVKYRPYDGKIRPKTWDDFEKNKTYFKSNEELLIGIKNSKINRNKVLFETWKKEFSSEDIKLITGE